ncbi:MAG: hypothetical protein RLZZ15_3959 [Verrucomicrobiota bacterium]|jgi:biopolymer transport protein ExbD
MTRPLDLAGRLRPEPRNLDALFFVNVGLLALFFAVFGSRFVLAPGLKLDLPTTTGARAVGVATTHYITVIDSGTIYSERGPIGLRELRGWLAAEAKKTTRPTLLVRAGANVKVGLQAEIASAAADAGFGIVWAAEDAARPGGGR